MKKRKLIIDGHNFLYRGYYGVPVEARLPSGREVNAVYGFFALLRNVVQHLDPEELIIVFDSETGIKSKLTEFPEYKAQRVSEVTTIFDQLELIKRILTIRDIGYIESPHHEADDLIGSYIRSFCIDDEIAFIASTDGDFMQLLSPSIKIVKSRHSNMEVIDEESFYKRYAIKPTHYLDFRSLKGDPSDNLGGIKGIGDKTASKLIIDHQSIENIYMNFDTLSTRVQSLLNGHEEYLYKVRDFITINPDIDMQNFNIPRRQFDAGSIPVNTRGVIEGII